LRAFRFTRWGPPRTPPAGELFPRRGATSDPFGRNVCLVPYGHDHAFWFVGDILSDEKNPGRTRAFDIRRVTAAGSTRISSRWSAGPRGAIVVPEAEVFTVVCRRPAPRHRLVALSPRYNSPTQ
jgi:hypothetical protein